MQDFCSLKTISWPYCICAAKAPWNIKKKLRSLNPFNERRLVTFPSENLKHLNKPSENQTRGSISKLTHQIPNAQQTPKIQSFENCILSSHILILPIYSWWIRTNTKKHCQPFLSILVFGSQNYWHLHPG